MKCTGACKCGKVKISVFTNESAENLHPRICDCDYCKKYPSSVVSHPTMHIDIKGCLDDLKIDKNGDGLAGFYRCPECNSLIVVGANIDGIIRGAVNANLLACDAAFGDSIHISPKLLEAHEKIERWGRLWGTVRESIA